MENDPSKTAPVDYLTNEIDFLPATTGQRFLNFLIDNLLMRYSLNYLTSTFFALVVQQVSPEFLNQSVAMDNFWGFLFLSLMVGYLNYVIYYTLCEKLFKGYTFGKLVTGTRAIRIDGGELTFKDSLYRSLCRLIPLEPLSGFSGRPWHDSLTDTRVIKSR